MGHRIPSAYRIKSLPFLYCFLNRRLYLSLIYWYQQGKQSGLRCLKKEENDFGICFTNKFAHEAV